MSCTGSLRASPRLLAALMLLASGCASTAAGPGGPGPSGARHDVAFTSRLDGNYEIFLLPAGTAEPLNLTNHPASDYWHCWAPDGERLALGSNRDGNDEIFVLAVDGSSCVNLTRHPASDKAPSWSPDGATIAFHSSRDQARGEIYLMDADGSNVRRLTFNEEYEECVAWSPDGARLAYCRLMPSPDAAHGDNDGEIYVMDRDGDSVQRVTHRPGFDSAPSWSPDGRRLAFHGREGEDTEIFVIGVDGTGLENVSRDPLENWQPSWSADGAEIAYCAGTPPHDYDIWVMEADGSARRRLTTYPGREQAPQMRP